MMTNLELVTDIMEFSETGALAQAVVMLAVETYVQQIVDGGIDEVKKIFPPTGLVSPEAWLRACQEIKRKLDKRRS